LNDDIGMMLPATPSFRLDGRNALVTGAGRGIGAAAAAALAQAGARVTLAARTGPELESVAASIRSAGGQAAVMLLDVTDAAAVAAEVAQAGPFDILVNSAGTNRPALLTDTSDADLDAVLDLNVRSTFLVCREVARGMVAAGRGGSIVTISSQMGHVGGPKRSVYCATKHAMEGMSKALAWELGPHGIRMNTLCPTFIETAMTAPMLGDPTFREYVQSRIALGRVGTLQDIMGAVVFLCSDAAALVTGSALIVDGGWTAA
jgi:NAD(P)-dependent dehydrogenase (short-subunit alcohol dehydrogenase family)